VRHALADDDNFRDDDSRDFTCMAFKSRGNTDDRPMVAFLAPSHAFYMFRPQPAHHAGDRFVAVSFADSPSAHEHAGVVARIARISRSNLRALYTR
jgi:hypothetical protein